MRIKHYLSVVAISALLASCAKEGPAGPQGDPGLNGVSNMTVTTYVIPASSWSQYNSNTWDVVTGSGIYTSDAVNVYVSLNNNDYTPLATSSFFVGGDNLTFVFSNTGNVTLWEYFNSAGPTVGLYAEVCDIPPALNIKYPNVNWNDYTQVSALPEFKAALVKSKIVTLGLPNNK